MFLAPHALGRLHWLDEAPDSGQDLNVEGSVPTEGWHECPILRSVIEQIDAVTRNDKIVPHHNEILTHGRLFQPLLVLHFLGVEPRQNLVEHVLNARLLLLQLYDAVVRFLELGGHRHFEHIRGVLYETNSLFELRVPGRELGPQARHLLLEILNIDADGLRKFCGLAVSTLDVAATLATAFLGFHNGPGNHAKEGRGEFFQQLCGIFRVSLEEGLKDQLANVVTFRILDACERIQCLDVESVRLPEPRIASIQEVPEREDHATQLGQFFGMAEKLSHTLKLDEIRLIRLDLLR
mmetsp:Transcript_28343/g.74775  ORF Transcript_28343/g.74775 Transcript_28343/m.74775 type:complete len:294 (+) Transcript_28343:566-1447(+)